MEDHNLDYPPGGYLMPIQNDFENQLNVLLMAVLRDFNAPLEAVESPSIQELIQYLNPLVTLPTVDSLLHTVSEEVQTGEHFYEEQETNSNESVTENQELPLDLTEIPSKHNMKSHPKDLSTALCIVCLKWQKICKVKRMSSREAAIFLSICVWENVHSIETAQELHSTIPLKCCMSHYDSIVEAGLKHLGIASVMDVPIVTEQAVADTFLMVKTIEDTMESEKTESRQKKIFGSFRQSLTCFFKKFAPLGRVRRQSTPVNTENSSSKQAIEPLKQSTFNNNMNGYDDFPEDFLEP